MAGRMLIVILICSFHDVQAQALLQAKLTVTPSAIKETDSVSFSCQAPPRVSVYECYFYMNGGRSSPFSCEKTFKGTELLLMSQKSSPAVIEARCFYTVKKGAVNAPSPHSDTSYITISLKPQLSFNPGEYVVFTCSLPGSVKHDTTCNLYFGESNRPAVTRTIKEKKDKNNQWFCQFFFQEDDFLRRLHLVQQKDASCDYSWENGGKPLSPRSDPYSSSEFTKVWTTTSVTPAELNKLQMTLTSALTTGQEPHATTALETSGPENQITTTKTTSARETSSVRYSTVTVTSKETETSEDKNPEGLRWVWLVSAAGITVGIFIFVLACVRVKRRTEKHLQKRNQASHTGELTRKINISNTNTMPAGKDEVILSVSSADCPTGSDELYKQKPQYDDSDVYHIYSTVSEFPPPQTNMVYSLLQTH